MRGVQREQRGAADAVRGGDQRGEIERGWGDYRIPRGEGLLMAWGCGSQLHLGMGSPARTARPDPARKSRPGRVGLALWAGFGPEM
jgi:hypothetical protein